MYIKQILNQSNKEPNIASFIEIIRLGRRDIMNIITYD